MASSAKKKAALLAKAARAVARADALLFTSGAGLGVDSGLPDFRGAEGFWRAYPPIRALGLTFPEMSNPAWFYRRPRLAWGFWGHRLALYADAVPHAGYAAMRRWGERLKGGDFFVFTSNVDGAFEGRAGFPADRLVECHGAVTQLQCRRPCARGADALWPSAGLRVPYDEATFECAEADVPTCPRCGEVARPAVMMFGDGAFDSGARLDAQEARFEAWLEALRERGRSLAVVEVGAGKAVPTVRLTGEAVVRAHEACGAGATLVRVNPLDSDCGARGVPHVSLPMGGLEALEGIDALL